MQTTKVTALVPFRHIRSDNSRVEASRGEVVEVETMHVKQLERQGMIAVKMDTEHQNKMMGVPENKQRLPEIPTVPDETVISRTHGRMNAEGEAPEGTPKVAPQKPKK